MERLDRVFAYQNLYAINITTSCYPSLTQTTVKKKKCSRNKQKMRSVWEPGEDEFGSVVPDSSQQFRTNRTQPCVSTTVDIDCFITP